MGDKDEPQMYKKRYKIDKKLGAGNFGTAYLVTDLKSKTEPKVLKVVRLGEMDENETVDSVREAELLSNLHNDYIVKFHESFLENDCLCIVTEFCEGGDLDQRLKELKKQNRTLEEDQVIEWLIQILIAVQYMHKSRILHRDLKARNIFLKNNKIKIGDFGISRILVGTMDVATTFTGTPYYMSPEVMKHDGYEAKSDIWSVGCLLYEMCTCQHAFDGKGLMNVIYKVVEGKPPELPKTYSKELNDLLKKMFIKDPKNRPTAAQLLEAPFLIGHRQRTKLTGPLENTINGKLRLNEINQRFEKSVNYGEMKDQKWTAYGKDFVPSDENDSESENTMQQKHLPPVHDESEEEVEEDEEQTMKPAQTMSATQRALMEKKMKAADANAQRISQHIQSEAARNQQMRREKTSLGTMRQTKSPDEDSDNYAEEPVSNYPRNAGPNRNAPRRAPFDGGYEDRPITPMRGSYQQVADKMGGDYDSGYYDRRANNQSPSRDNERTLSSQRVMSASQRSMNSMSRTIGPHRASNYQQREKYVSPAKTLGGSMTREKSTLHDDGATLRDAPKNDAYGPQAREAKIHNLRATAISKLGEATFEKVYDYYVKQRTLQRTDPNLDDGQIAQGLKSIVNKTTDCFEVDQLVFLELMRE
ncbi:unnamed protein product [Adineta ricciae]|uniref:non-specific serine/threonine protein kinase n=1 Tax=Adineta ricciae TaxID=249248 RepID=A0A814LCP9_ADIRI|nr:unnamed protein product [Adineta ricciae]CAF1387141.1 unnamed protein product [Adineta ricciae]